MVHNFFDRKVVKSFKLFCEKLNKNWLQIVYFETESFLLFIHFSITATGALLPLKIRVSGVNP